MIIFGIRTHSRREAGGSFRCAACGSETNFAMLRTYNYFHVYFVPIWRLDLVSEQVVCERCGATQPVSVLASNAKGVSSAFLAGQDTESAVGENLGNVVVLTEDAVAEILRRHGEGSWTTEAAVRITPVANGYAIAFDYPLTDGRDWIGQSHHIPLLVDRRDAPLLLGKTIDFRQGRFCDAC